MINKKGSMWNIIILVGGLIFLLLLAAVLTIGFGVVKSATDVIIPEFASIGDVGAGGNVSEYVAMTTTPLNNIIGNLGLMIALLYIIGIVGVLSYAFIFKDNFNGWVVAFFLVSVMLMIITSIAISQYYEEFHNGQDELGEILRSASLVSYLIIYSPTVLTIVAFIAAAILFTGNREDAYNV